MTCAIERESNSEAVPSIDIARVLEESGWKCCICYMTWRVSGYKLTVLRGEPRMTSRTFMMMMRDEAARDEWWCDKVEMRYSDEGLSEERLIDERLSDGR